MDFNQLENFLAVVNNKSFSKAAKELFLAQPTISNNIQNLEKELDTTLIDRKSKTITLTHSGKVLYDYAVELINIRDKAIHKIKEQGNKIQGNIEINASTIPEQYILPHIIKNFTEEYPEVLFSVTHKNSGEIIDDILKGKQIFGMVGAKHPSKMLKYINFFEDELVLAVPNKEKYSMLADEPLDIDILFSEKFIFRKEGSGTRLLIEQNLEKVGISPGDLKIVSFLDSIEMIKKMIELDLGVSFLSRISIENEIKLNLIKAFRIKGLNFSRKFYFVYNKNRTLPPVVSVFKDFLLA